MDANSFRAIMRHQAGAVALICSGKTGARVGLTATAVCSLTDDPPTILVCVNKNASAHDTIAQSRQFSVNLLTERHSELAGIFSGQTELSGEARFLVEGYNWAEHASGTPWLKEAVANLDCTVTDQQEFSSHSVFIGKVSEGAFDAKAPPLIYCRGAFSGLAVT